MRALSSRLSTARSIRADDPDTQVGATRASKITLSAPAVGGGHLDGLQDDQVEPDGFGGQLGLFAPGQLGHVADQGGQLVHLGERRR